MPNIRPIIYDITGNNKTRHYIETGAYYGNGIKSVLNNYEFIHSIELSDKWYNYNVEQFRNNTNVKMYLGDSKKVLPELLETIQEPVTIYLDAHYSGGTTAFGEEETPLLCELEILKNRKYDDIIIIDDCRLLGKSGECGNNNNPVYPVMQYNWTNITNEKINELKKEKYVIFVNNKLQITDGSEDQYLLIKNNCI